jgi:gluconokinase
MQVIAMGVSGVGKTTVARGLSAALGWTYAEGDEFHSAANVAKLASGHPLTDDDRWPWLEAIGRWIDERRAGGEPAIVTCSALKRSYRDLLRRDRPEVLVAYLDGSHDLIAGRLIARHGHFFAPSMLDSQFADLEPPAPDEDVLSVPIDGTPPDVVGRIIEGFGLRPDPPYRA